MENLQTSSLNKENEIFNVKSVAKKEMIFYLLKTTPFILIVLFFAIPFINVNIVIDEIKISMFDLIFSTKNSETIKGVFASGLMSDYFALGQNYENIIQGIYESFSKSNVFNNAFSVSDVPQVLIGVGNVFASFGSVLCFVFVPILSLIFGIKSIFTGNVEASLRGINNQTFEEIFYPESNRQIENNKNYYDVKQKVRRIISKSMIRINIQMIIAWIIVLALYLYLPVKIIIFLIETPLVNVDIIFLALCIICLLIACIFTVVEYFYSIKMASILNKGQRAKMIMKNVAKK